MDGQAAFPPRVRLLALDIDDTITGPDGLIGAANREAIDAARKRGIEVTVVTGRRYLTSAQKLAAELGLDGLIGCHYGRALVEHPSGAFAARHCLAPVVCRRVLAYAREHGLLTSLCADEVFFFGVDTDTPTVEPSMPLAESVRDLGKVLDERGHRVMSMAVSGAGAEGLRDALADAVAARHVQVYNQRAARQGQVLAVVLDGSHDKGTALEEICRARGIPLSEVVAMGDSEADIPLLRTAGLGVAMPWADEHVRAAAGRVASGAWEDAVAGEIAAMLAWLGRD
ncbi:MAG: HAD-IIB family hydrolase [Bacillota bacterium]|nr:HAD-IIB family hydrolase [Bacillota bacterium]